MERCADEDEMCMERCVDERRAYYEGHRGMQMAHLIVLIKKQRTQSVRCFFLWLLSCILIYSCILYCVGDIPVLRLK